MVISFLIPLGANSIPRTQDVAEIIFNLPHEIITSTPSSGSTTYTDARPNPGLTSTQAATQGSTVDIPEVHARESEGISGNQTQETKQDDKSATTAASANPTTDTSDQPRKLINIGIHSINSQTCHVNSNMFSSSLF